MSSIRVWAPKASLVELVVEGHRSAMNRDDGGWWSLDSASLTPGTRYTFALDGGPGLPDPRSASQPIGVSGPSEVVNSTPFVWTDGYWNACPLSSAVIYELHVGTFSEAGTFDGVIEHLPHLVDLGVTHVELMPVAEFSGDRGWGYDGVDLFAPHHAYGGPDGLKRLVNACHQHGLAVIMDVVYNHFGPAGNYLNQFGYYQTGRYQTPWGDAVNFDDCGSAEVRRFLCDSALTWLRDYHCDGLRIDAVHEIIDRSAIHFLEQLAAGVRALEARVGRHLTIIAESDLNDPRIVRPVEVGGYGMDAQWSDDFHHAIHAYLTGERSGYYADFGSLRQIAKAIQNAFVYDGCYSSHRQRIHGRPPLGVSGHRFLGYLQNHDQVGNRAQGERISVLLNAERVKIAAALVFTAPFVPMIFQGEEWAASSPFQYFSGHLDPDLGKAVSEGRKREFVAFGWKEDEVPDPQAIKTYERSRLKWQELTAEPHAGFLRWYRDLIQLRKQAPELTDGCRDLVEVQFDEAEKWLVLQRARMIIVCNFANQVRPLNIGKQKAVTILLASKRESRVSSGVLEAPSESVTILMRSA